MDELILHIRPRLFDKTDLIRRHIIICIMAMGFGALNIFNIDSDAGFDFWLSESMGNFVFIFLIWNGNMLALDVLDRFWNWTNHFKLKMILTILIAIVLPIFFHVIFTKYIFPFIHHRTCLLSSKESITYLIVSVTTTLLINAIFIAITFFQIWKKSLVEKEALKRSILTANIEALKQQVNPHFLFNSLNTLAGLVEENPRIAEAYIHELANVYRYVLQYNQKEIAVLSDEINFAKSYFYLNQIRYGDNIQLILNVSEVCLNRNVLSLSLQLLLENAMKHNVISTLKPLTIQITCDDNYLHVINNFQAKLQTIKSEGIGLKNIMERYQFYTDKKVEIASNEKQFIVSIPLL